MREIGGTLGGVLYGIFSIVVGLYAFGTIGLHIEYAYGDRIDAKHRILDCKFEGPSSYVSIGNINTNPPSSRTIYKVDFHVLFEPNINGQNKFESTYRSFIPIIEEEVINFRNNYWCSNQIDHILYQTTNSHQFSELFAVKKSGEFLTTENGPLKHRMKPRVLGSLIGGYLFVLSLAVSLIASSAFIFYSIYKFINPPDGEPPVISILNNVLVIITKVLLCGFVVATLLGGAFLTILSTGWIGFSGQLLLGIVVLFYLFLIAALPGAALFAYGTIKSWKSGIGRTIKLAFALVTLILGIVSYREGYDMLRIAKFAFETII